MRAAQRILTGVFMVVLLTTVFVATACGKDQAIIAGPAGADPTVVSTTGGTTTTVAPTTTTTVDPAAVQAFLDAWHESETTTTTAPPPPTTQAPKPKVTSPPTTGRPPVTSAPAPAPAQQGTGACGGDLPPCYVMMRESGGNITAQNPSSTASGKWQFLDSTWQGYGGYAKARYAPESVQDAKARALWAGGRGCSHWSAC